MALPKWQIPVGSLGIVPELDIWTFPPPGIPIATDLSGGELEYFLVSGKLPLGIQVIRAGKLLIPSTGLYQPTLLQGVPVSELGPDQNVTYTFTIRARNTSTGGIADRTFTLTVTNISPPIIVTPPRNSYLGLYIDGSIVNTQLEAVEFLPGANLIWSLKSGDLPETLTLSPSGLLEGYILPIDNTAPGYIPYWDRTTWNYLGWDFPVVAISKTFTFTVEVSDGFSYDLSTYTLRVFPRGTLTCDNDELEVDSTSIGINITDLKHDPIILTKQEDFVAVRDTSYFSFKINAIDLDDDRLKYAVPSSATGAYDEQQFDDNNLSYPYVASTRSGANLYAGVFPNASVSSTLIDSTTSRSTYNYTRAGYKPGDPVKVFVINDTETGSGYWALANVTSLVTVRISGNTKINANIGAYITQGNASSANALISNVSATVGTISLTGQTVTGYINTVLPSYVLGFSGNITASPGNYLTQPISGANAKVISVVRTGTLTFNDTVFTDWPTEADANIIVSGGLYIGDTITQISSGANAVVTQNFDTANNLAYVTFTSGTFTIGSGNIKITGGGANVSANSVVVTTLYPTSSNVFTTSANVLFLNGNTSLSNTQVNVTSITGNIRINGSWLSPNVRIISSTKDSQQITFSANIGDVITQVGNTGNAVVTETVSDTIKIPVKFNSGVFGLQSGNVRINGTDIGIWITGLEQTSNPFNISVTQGQYITQGTANAVVIANVVNGTTIPVRFLANTNFTSGNILSNVKLNGSNINAYPRDVICNTDIAATYLNPNNLFVFNWPYLSNGAASISGTSTGSKITSLVGVGTDLWLPSPVGEEGTVGFDEGRYDQGVLALPPGITLDEDSGWLTGIIPSQAVSRADYQFEISAYKADENNYIDSKLYTLTVLGDLNNRIDWISPIDLGTIDTGKVSDLFVYAVSALGKTVFYELAPNSYLRLPQGLQLSLNGLITGRVSFEVFSLDQGLTTIDGGDTSFDFKYEFTVVARDSGNTVRENRTFTLTIRQFDKIPYENLYLKAMPTLAQRKQFESILTDQSIFPMEKIYRFEDPWFGLSKDIKTLFIAGLSPATVEQYAIAAQTNHFTKRLTFGNIKTAQALDSNFNVKYEVVYLEVYDSNTVNQHSGLHEQEIGPINAIELAGRNANPYYDLNGISYSTAYPNSFYNMENVMINAISYQDKGVLPDWMTSRQSNGRQLGFVHAAVLAYVKPGESDFVAYRLRQRNFNFNEIDFTVDRYQLDNIYTANYDIASNAFVVSTETTFDRYPALSTTFRNVGTVNYAVSISYESINNHTVEYIRSLGGLDGVKGFKDGDTLVFAEQEFPVSQININDEDYVYNYGWAGALVTWDGGTGWAENADTTDNDNLPPQFDPTPGQQWDQTGYIPGFKENNFDPSVSNRRIGVWRINVSPESELVTLSYQRQLLNQTSSIDGNVLTVNGIVNGALYANVRIFGTGIASNTYVVEQLTSLENDEEVLGKSGTYRLNQLANASPISSTAIYQDIKYYDTLFVKNGFTYGSTRIFYEPKLKTGKNYYNYSIKPEQISIVATTFDGSGTRFFDRRDSYVIPGQGDKYIKFAKTGVFT